MNRQIDPKEKFRRGFILLMTTCGTVAFLGLIKDFINTLLLAAVFTCIVYPFFCWLQRVLAGRKALASFVTLCLTLVAIVLPLLILFGLVSEQALEIAEDVKPWIEQKLESSDERSRDLPSWVPFSGKLEYYHDDIKAKLGEAAGKTGVYIASSLGKLTQGTVVFFLHLFVMLYAMFFYLVHGPSLIEKIMGYAPIAKTKKDKMLEVGLSVSRATIKGTLVIGIIQGVLGGIGFAVAGIKTAVFWGVIMVVLSIIPGIGATLVWGPAVIYLFISNKMLAAVGLLIWSAGVVGTVDNVLRPILVGRDTQMPDLLILLSTLGGLALFGASGLVLGPILAALYLTVLTIYSQVFADWLDQN